MTTEELRQLLFSYRDEKYGDFTAKLIPGLPRERIIGIRAPMYKKILREIRNDPVIPAFLAELPHYWHEENCLHAALLNDIRDYPTCVEAVERFLPYINNWAVNDGLNPPCFRQHHEDLILRVQRWIGSDAPYTRRCGMHILMTNFLGEDFCPEYLDQPADLRSGEYYVNMMTAWLFAEALAQQWDAVLPFLQTCRLDPWTHNMTIRKACESFKVPDEHKELLRSMRIPAKRK